MTHVFNITCLGRRGNGHPRCVAAVRKTVEYALFICLYWNAIRCEIEMVIGKALIPNDVPDLLLGTEEELLRENDNRKRIWEVAESQRKAFNHMVTKIFSDKEI